MYKCKSVQLKRGARVMREQDPHCEGAFAGSEKTNREESEKKRRSSRKADVDPEIMWREGTREDFS